MSKINVNKMEARLVEAKAWMLNNGRVNCLYYDTDVFEEDVIENFENLTLEEVLRARYRFILNVGKDGHLYGMDTLNIFDTVEGTTVEFGLFARHIYDRCEDVFDGKIIDITILASLIDSEKLGTYVIVAKAEDNINTYQIHSRCYDIIDTALKRYENTDKLYVDITQEVVNDKLALSNTEKIIDCVVNKGIEIDDGNEGDLVFDDKKRNITFVIALYRDGNVITIKQILCQS